MRLRKGNGGRSPGPGAAHSLSPLLWVSPALLPAAECQNLIEGLLQLKPAARLGLQQVATHRWMLPATSAIFHRVMSSMGVHPECNLSPEKSQAAQGKWTGPPAALLRATHPPPALRDAQIRTGRTDPHAISQGSREPPCKRSTASASLGNREPRSGRYNKPGLCVCTELPCPGHRFWARSSAPCPLQAANSRTRPLGWQPGQSLAGSPAVLLLSLG